MTRPVAWDRRATTATSDRRDLAHLPRGNDSYPWDDFDPDWYAAFNYGVLRDDDRRILQVVRDFFAIEVAGRKVRRGIDVGSGANIYPAMAMLPFCDGITLWERGKRNCAWLRNEIDEFSDRWDPYWDVLTTRKWFRSVERPREALREQAEVLNRSMFNLPRRLWDMGTMFFVAESISERRREFERANRVFLGSLRQNAPFAAAFMLGSTGYNVGSLRFPAVAVSEVDVRHCLSVIAHDVRIVSVRSDKKLRDGYNGMVLALGKAGSAS